MFTAATGAVMADSFCYAECGERIKQGDETEYIFTLDELCHKECYSTVKSAWPGVTWEEADAETLSALLDSW